MFGSNKSNLYVSNIKLIVHPYYDFNYLDGIDNFHSVWLDSLKQSSKDKNCYLVLALALDNPTGFEKQEKVLISKARRYFKKRNLIKRSGAWFTPEFFSDEALEKKIVPKKTKVFASGVYTDNCVISGLKNFLLCFGLEKGYINLNESKDIRPGYQQTYHPEKFEGIPTLDEMRGINPLIPIQDFTDWQQEMLSRY